MTFEEFTKHSLNLGFKAANVYYLNFDPATLTEKTCALQLLDSITSNAYQSRRIDFASIDPLNGTMRLDGMKVRYEVLHAKQ